jgi:hypothetical protein
MMKYITQVDFLKLDIASVKFRPRAGHVLLAFVHQYHGYIFDVEIQFYLYNEKENFWVTKWTIYPKEDLWCIAEPARILLKRSIERIFGPMVARAMRGESCLKADI